MEIKYSKYKANPEIFKENTLTTLIDKTGLFIENNIYDIKVSDYGDNKTVKQYLNLGLLSLTENVTNEILSDLELDKEILQEKISNLPTGSKIKIDLIKHLIDKSETVILDHIDLCLNENDLKVVLKVCNKKYKNINKTLIYIPNKIDNAIIYTKNFVVAEDGEIKYIGNDYAKIETKSSIMEFVDSANKKGANLKYYKEPSDLLKAIYRSVKK